MEEQLLDQVVDNVRKKKCPDWKKQLLEQQELKFTEKYKPQVITALKYSPTLESAVKNSKGKTNLPPTLVKKIQTEDRDMQKIIQNMENELIDLICNDSELHATIMEALSQETEEKEIQFKRRKIG
jgi:acetyl-CoA carboxylase beta subunit